MNPVRTASLFIACTAMGLANAQLPTVDLTLAANGPDQLEARVRPDGDFDEFLAAIVFTVRWPASSGASMDLTFPGLPTLGNLTVSPSGPVLADGGYNYQIFVGQMAMPLFDAGDFWPAHLEQTLCTIDLLGPAATFELVNDSFTNAENADYFVSLNSFSQAGIFFTSPEPDVDIRSMMGAGDTVLVALRPLSDFFGMVSDLDFTVRWPSASGTSFGAVVQDAAETIYLPIVKVGPEIDDGGWRYQRFEGTGLHSVANGGSAWLAGQDHVVLRLPFVGPATTFEVVNDAWTATNNGDYAISLNGTPHTGLITGLPSQPADAGLDVEMIPTPDGICLQLQADHARDLDLQLYDASGKLVWQQALASLNGRYTHTVNMNDRGSGMYLLRATSADRCIVQRAVFSAVR